VRTERLSNQKKAYEAQKHKQEHLQKFIECVARTSFPVTLLRVSLRVRTYREILSHDHPHANTHSKFRYNAKRAALVQSRIKALNRMSVLEDVVDEAEFRVSYTFFVFFFFAFWSLYFVVSLFRIKSLNRMPVLENLTSLSHLLQRKQNQFEFPQPDNIDGTIIGCVDVEYAYPLRGEVAKDGEDAGYILSMRLSDRNCDVTPF
jgi:hypothetical protein